MSADFIVQRDTTRDIESCDAFHVFHWRERGTAETGFQPPSFGDFLNLHR